MWFWNSKEIIIRSSKPPVVKRDPKKSCSVGIGIQSKQGWQVSYYCLNAIENKLFVHLHISFSPHTWHAYSHSIILSQRFLGIPIWANLGNLDYSYSWLTKHSFIDSAIVNWHQSFFWNWKLDFKLIMFAKLDLQTYIFEKYWIFCKPELTYSSNCHTNKCKSSFGVF